MLIAAIASAVLSMPPEAALATDLYVSDFGAVGDGRADDGPALRRAFEAAAQMQGFTRILFDGDKTYYLAPEPEDNGRLMLSFAEDVMIDGRGATLLVHPSNRALGVYRSKNITLRNLQLDYRPLPYTQGTIRMIDNAESVLEFVVQGGYQDPKVADESFYTDARHSDSVTMNKETRKFYHAHARVSAVKALGERAYQVQYRGRPFTQAREGDFFTMKLDFPAAEPPRDQNEANRAYDGAFMATPDPSIAVNQCDGIRVENIRSYASPGMTLTIRGSYDIEVLGLTIIRKDDRLVASCSDGIHVKGNESQPLIRDCYFEGTMDDSIHIKISGDWVREIQSPTRFRIEHMDIPWDSTSLALGKKVMVYSHDQKRALATATIAVYAPIDYRNGWVTLDQPVPDLKVGDTLYLDAVNEARIENCRFETQLQRAILTHQPTTIRNCQIRDNGAGVVVDFADIEGPPSQRLRVENCTFTNLVRAGIHMASPSKDYDQKGDPQLICEGNTFTLPEGVPALHVYNSNGVALFDNTYYYTGDETPNAKHYVRINNSPLRIDEGNRFEALSR